MELTPDLLLEAKFAPARRGYDMHEVDDFLERCAEGLDVLLTRLKAEFERAERAEERAAAAEAAVASGAAAPAPAARVEEPEPAPEPAPVVAAEPAPVTEEQVAGPMRILLAAERTAEAAIADARAEAERIRSEAESVASTARSEAEAMLARSRAEAEAEARQAGEDARRAIEAEVLALRTDREVLSADVQTLRRWLDDQRERMRTTARDLQRLVDDPAALGGAAAPELPSDEAAADDPTDDFDDEDHMLVLDDGEPTQSVPVFDALAEEEESHSAPNGHAGASPIR